MKTATLIKELPVTRTGARQRLYKLSEPLEGHTYVVVSAVDAYATGPETYIFGGNEEGEVVDWLDLPGSFRGSFNYEEALNGAGYEVK